MEIRGNQWPQSQGLRHLYMRVSQSCMEASHLVFTLSWRQVLPELVCSYQKTTVKFNDQNTSYREHTESGNDVGFRTLHDKRSKLFFIPLTYKTEASSSLLADPSLIVSGSSRCSDLFLDSINDAGVSQSTKVTQLITLSRRDLAHNTAHDLTGSCLGEVWNDYDLLWGREGPDDLPDLKD